MARKYISGNVWGVLPIFAFVFAFAVRASFSQTSALNGPWSGQAQCQVSVQGQGYSHQENHTWTLNGAQSTPQGAMHVFPATWSVTGQGSLQRANGAQTLQAQWTVNSPPMNAPIALFVRASDGALILKAWHSQLRANSAVTLTQQLVVNGIAQAPGTSSGQAFEWTFPAAEVPSTSTSISGSNTIATNGSVGPMQPGGSQGTASCTWNFAAGTSMPVGIGGGQNSGAGTGPVSNPGGMPGSSTGTTVPGGSSGTGSGSSGTGTGSNPGTSGGSTSGTGSTSTTNPGGQNPPPSSTGSGTVSLPPGVSKTPLSGATLLGSCPAPPSTPGNVIARPYCLHQGQQNVAMTFTAVPPFQLPQGTYGAGSFNGINLKSASWSANGVIGVADVDPTFPPGPGGYWFTYAPSAGICCTIIDLGSSPFVVVSAPTSKPTSPLLNSGTTSASSGSAPVLTVTPNLGHAGQQNLQLTIVASSNAQPFQAGATLDLGGWGVTVASVNVVSPTQAVAVIYIDPAARSARVVSLTNPDGSGNLVVQGFTVGP